MKIQYIVFTVILGLGLLSFPNGHAQSTVSIIMEKTTYTYCERLFYTVQVSEITGNPAIIHIRDQAGKGSSAIPIPITDLKNPIPSLIPFEESIFPVGKYFVEVEYEGVKVSSEFDLVDGDKICIPGIIQQILTNWLTGNISDGFMMDAFEKYVDKKLMNIPYDINENNVYEIDIPDWVKNVAWWWMEHRISDDEFSQVINYLVDKKIIYPASELKSDI